MNRVDVITTRLAKVASDYEMSDEEILRRLRGIEDQFDETLVMLEKTAAQLDLANEGKSP